MLYLAEHCTSLSLISFTISLDGTERKLIDLKFPGCLSIIKKIIIVLSMLEALPIWASQSTPHQDEGTAGWRQPFSTFTLQEGRRRESNSPMKSTSQLNMALPPHSWPSRLSLKSLAWFSRVRKGWCFPVCIILPEHREISSFFPQNQPCNISSSEFVREMLFIRICQTLLSVYFMHYLLQSPETNATSVPVIYCTWVSQADP